MKKIEKRVHWLLRCSLDEFTLEEVLQRSLETILDDPQRSSTLHTLPGNKRNWFIMLRQALEKLNTQDKFKKKRQVPEKIIHPGKVQEINTSPRKIQRPRQSSRKKYKSQKKSNTQAKIKKKIQVPEKIKYPGKDQLES